MLKVVAMNPPPTGPSDPPGDPPKLPGDPPLPPPRQIAVVDDAEILVRKPSWQHEWMHCPEALVSMAVHVSA